MNIEKIHDCFIKNRRARILHQKLIGLIPESKTSLLDIGCGDGAIARHLMNSNPLLEITGIDPLVRGNAEIPVTEFNGLSIPYPDSLFDFCLFVDVLHHANDPFVLLQEASRVAKHGIIIKDHKLDGLFAKQTLRFMDDTHNRRYGVSLPYNYWAGHEWTAAFNKLNLQTAMYETNLKLYPIWADWLFGRNLHFLGLFVKKMDEIK